MYFYGYKINPFNVDYIRESGQQRTFRYLRVRHYVTAQINVTKKHKHFGPYQVSLAVFFVS